MTTLAPPDDAVPAWVALGERYANAARESWHVWAGQDRTRTSRKNKAVAA